MGVHYGYRPTGNGFYAPPLVTSNLVLHFDVSNASSYPGSGSTITDLSGRNNNGTIDPGVTFQSANPSYLDFDYGQGSDRITVANSADLNYSFSDWCYNFWIFYESANSGAWKQFFVKGDGNTLRRPGVWFYIDDPQKLHLTWNNNDGQQTIDKTGFSVPVGVWSNIVIQARSGVLMSFLNGVQDVNTLSISNKGTNSSPLYIGNIFGSYTAPNMRFGVVSVYNFSLTNTQITQNFNALRNRYGL